MGSEDLFHKRKEANIAAKQKTKARLSKQRFLIVCEGGKTEPNYLRALRDDLKIQPTLVDIVHSKDNSPMGIFTYAKEIYEKSKKQSDPYDTVYCVFDRDTHKKFEEALDKINKTKKFESITTNPCFEFWLLLHFKYTSAAYKQKDKKSVGDQVEHDLKQFDIFANYKKGQKDIYTLCKEKLSIAITNARQLRKEMESSVSQKNNPQIDANPWTNFDVLVEAIQNQSKKVALN
jgi:RloB-like protein